MAVTTLAQALHDLWVSRFPGTETMPSATLRSGLVTDLIQGDFLIGLGAIIISVGAVTGTNKAFTVRRTDGIEFSVSMPTTATVWFTR